MTRNSFTLSREFYAAHLGGTAKPPTLLLCAVSPFLLLLTMLWEQVDGDAGFKPSLSQSKRKGVKNG